jgi:hypothetical protein
MMIDIPSVYNTKQMVNATCIVLPVDDSPLLVAAPALLLPLLMLFARRADPRVALLVTCAVSVTQWEPVRSLWCDACGTLSEFAQWLAFVWLVAPFVTAGIAFLSTVSKPLASLRRAVPFASLAYAACTPVLFAGLRTGIWGDLSSEQQAALATTLLHGHLAGDVDAALAFASRALACGMSAQLVSRPRERAYVWAQVGGGALVAAAAVLTVVRECDGGDAECAPTTPLPYCEGGASVSTCSLSLHPVLLLSGAAAALTAGPTVSRRLDEYTGRWFFVTAPVRIAAALGSVALVYGALVAPQQLPERGSGSGAECDVYASAARHWLLDGAAVVGVGTALALYTPPSIETSLGAIATRALKTPPAMPAPTIRRLQREADGSYGLGPILQA